MVSHVWVPLVKKKLMMCLAVSTLYRRVSDGQTNGIVCAYAGHRAVKKGTLGRYGVVVVIIIDKLYNIDASPIPSHFTTHSASSLQSYTNGRHGVDGRQRSPTGLQGLHDYITPFITTLRISDARAPTAAVTG